MGIPKFFKWLTRRYPLILQSVKYEEDVPAVDNLYLDINGIVHNCIHGNDSSKHERMSRLEDLEEVWANIMRAVDEIVHTVKPRKLILLAVDGVAPRAKMNQQRERRFRSAKDAAELRATLQAQGKTVPEVFDTNQISPGTDFMHELGRQLEWFVKHKLNTDPLYQNCRQVVLSDSSVPGEGEHKMLDYIRNAKGQADYDPNTRHCFYGADADLIMLSLLTHEPHFMIIREEHVVRKSKHGGVQRIDIERTSDFQLIHISLLREYFFLEYRAVQPQMRMRFDIERIIDDFVFFCFFIGNDFLPSLSALDVSEGSLDHLIGFYKKYLPQATDYITDNGVIHWDRAEPFIGLLGKYEHQVFVNRVKTIQKQYADSRNVLTFGADDVTAQMGKLTAGEFGPDRTRSVQETLQAKVKAKKLVKCKGLHQNNKQKKYKKFLLLKKFEELDPDEGESVPAAKRAYHAKQMQKYRGLMEIQLEQEQATAELDKMGLSELVGDLKEQYLSDLNPEDIPNSEISEVSEGELEAADPAAEQMALQRAASQKAEEAIESNHTFMLDFVNTYKEDSNAAKRNYYLAKLKFDVAEPRGKRDLQKLLYRYLEGLQWVLFYYYRGSQHWRWYYPYHYAPMISDLGTNIVTDFLNGATTITTFRTDTNCNADPTPYTPFQQLLCILPVKSMRQFLPASYADLAAGSFAKYFPASFEIDLNGRTLPWQAVILIPFVDEDLFLSAEQELLDNGKLTLTDRERTRNGTSFVYPYYTFDRKANGGELPSSLTNMRPLENNKAVKHLCHDYAECGKSSFNYKLLPGVVCPQPGFPSLDWLRVAGLEFREIFVQKVSFKQALCIIPTCKEDYASGDFEAYINSLCGQASPELYVDFPWQIEASPVSFEDPEFIYQVYHDAGTGMRVAKSRNPKSPDEFRHQGRLLANDLEKKGFAVDVDKTNAFVSYNALNACEYDENQDAVFKLFKEDAVWLPLSMVMKTRDPSHYLNINGRVDAAHGRIRNGGEAIIFHQDYFGIVGRVKSKNMQRASAAVAIDAEAESAKLHHPFLVENFLRREFSAVTAESLPEKGSKKVPSAEAAQVVQDVVAKGSAKRYFGDQEIEVVLGLKRGVVNRLTSSFLVAFDEPGKEERQVVDLGLNLKNFTKKVHVAEFVRFIAPGAAAQTIYDEFNHDRAARGSKHIRKHWEYSQDCFEIIKEYIEKFPEILVAIAANQKHNKGMNSLFDLYPSLSKGDKAAGIAGARAITTWIEALPISKLPYVEMGFDALDSAIIERLQDHIRHVSHSYEQVNLNVSKQLTFQTLFLYQEMYPHWFSPYLNRQRISDFRVGNRVMNLNSTLRQYIPFGLRGTVVGKTEEYVIVLFDEQFLHGTDVNGHCESYRGAKVYPLYLMNLSRSFAQLAKDAKNYNALKQFQERPKKGEVEFEDQLSPTEAQKRKELREAQALLNKVSDFDDDEKDEKEEVPVEKTAKAPVEEMKASEKTSFDADAPAFKPKAVWQPKQDQVGKVAPADVGVAGKKEPAVRQRNYGLGQPKPQMPQKKTPQMPGQKIPTAPLKEIGTKAEPVARQPEQIEGEKPPAGKFLFEPLNLNIKGLDDKPKEEKKGPE